MSQPPNRPTRAIITDQEALLFHSRGRPGKIEIVATKPMATQRDLSLAYSPGVAVPVKAIAADADLVVVIGSANSSNSQRLREVAERAGATRAVLLPTADALDWAMLDGVRTLGITAGAQVRHALLGNLR